VRMIVVGDFSADWLRIKANAAHTSVSQIVHSMVRDKISAASG
jgi:hypothetical protein